MTRDFPRAELRRISMRFRDQEGAVFLLQRAGHLTDKQREGLLKKIDLAEKREHKRAFAAADRKAP